MTPEIPYMPKDHLVTRLLAARARLEALIERIGEDHLDQPGVEGEWSVKDVIAHLMAYEYWIAGQVNREGWIRFPVPREKMAKPSRISCDNS
jgi:uncharacterized damage-inducible protein DinB